MKTIFAVLLLVAPLVATANEGFGRLTPAEVKAKLGQKNVYIFDNNAKEAYATAHLPGAKWLDPTHIEAKELPADHGATLIFYCMNEH